MTARLDVTPKTTEQNRIVCTSKSKAKVTNNKQEAQLSQRGRAMVRVCLSSASTYLQRSFFIISYYGIRFASA